MRLWGGKTYDCNSWCYGIELTGRNSLTKGALPRQITPWTILVMTKNQFPKTTQQPYDSTQTDLIQSEAVNRVLFKLPGLINASENLVELFKATRVLLSEIMDTANFYVALYNHETDTVTFPYCVDIVEGHYLPIEQVSKTASLTAEVIRTESPLMTTKQETLNERAKSPYKPPLCTPSAIWLGVPLKTNNGLLGVMTVQNYEDQNCYDQVDFDVLLTVAGIIAHAVEMNYRANELVTVKDELHQTIEEVHTLRGLLPLCPSCNRPRDSEEYLEEVSNYFNEYHGSETDAYICSPCLKEKFPELALLNSGQAD